MILAALTLALVVSGASVSPWSRMALYGAAGAADMASTEYALSRGYSEVNPILRQRWARVASPVVSGVVMGLLDARLSRRHPRAARVIRWAIVGARLGLAARNIRIARR